MGALFGIPKKKSTRDNVTDEDRAILSLKLQRDKLKIAQKRYENNIIKDKEIAKKLLNDGRKEQALFMLKRKKLQETLITQIFGQQDKIEQMIHNLENALLNQEVFARLKQGTEALQKLNEMFTVEDAEKIMEESQEAQSYQEEISNIIASNLNSEDLNDVEQELENLIAEQLPKVPTQEISQIKDDKIVENLKKEAQKKVPTALLAS